MLQEQLTELSDSGADYVIVWDEVFVQEGPRFDAFLQPFSDAGLGFGCNTRFNTLTDLTIDALAGAGCRSVLIGVEAEPEASDEHRFLRTDLGKRPSTAAYQRITGQMRAAGISPVASVIVGLPDDGPAEIEERLALCGELGFEHVYARPLVPFPESRLYREAVAAGRLLAYDKWDAAQYDSFPYGYPVVSPIARDELWSLIQRPR